MAFALLAQNVLDLVAVPRVVRLFLDDVLLDVRDQLLEEGNGHYFALAQAARLLPELHQAPLDLTHIALEELAFELEAFEALAYLLLHVLASDRRRRVHVDACRQPRWRDRTGKSACRRWHAGEPPTLRVQGSQTVARR